MKIFNHLAEQDHKQEQLFAFDSPLFKKSQGALSLTVYLSAISVTIGMYFQFFPFEASTIVQFFSYMGLALFVFMWAKYIDGTSTSAVEWIVNSLQNNVFWIGTKERVRTIILLIKWSIAVVLLAWLSLSLSEISAEKAGNVFSGEAKTADTKVFVDQTEDDKAAAMEKFDELYNQTVKQYVGDIEAIEAPFLDKIEQYKGYIQNAKTQMRGVELQAYINKQNGNIARQKAKMNKATDLLRKEKTEALAVIRNDQKAERERLNRLNDSNLSGTVASNSAVLKEHTKFKNTFSGLLSFIAGYSILIALLISGAIGLMKGRAGFVPKPILTGFDYKHSPFIEILLTPLVIIERLSLNAARWLKDMLPDLKEPEKEFSYNEYEGNIVPLRQSDRPTTTIPTKKKKIAASTDDSEKKFFFRDYGKKEVPATGDGSTELERTHEPVTHELKHETEPAHTKISHAIKGTPKEVPPELDLRQLKQRLKDYKKRLGKHIQKAKALEQKGEEVPNRTLSAISNNRGWINAYEVALNDKIQSFKRNQDE